MPYAKKWTDAQILRLHNEYEQTDLDLKTFCEQHTPPLPYKTMVPRFKKLTTYTCEVELLPLYPLHLRLSLESLILHHVYPRIYLNGYFNISFTHVLHLQPISTTLCYFSSVTVFSVITISLAISCNHFKYS